MFKCVRMTWAVFLSESYRHTPQSHVLECYYFIAANLCGSFRSRIISGWQAYNIPQGIITIVLVARHAASMVVTFTCAFAMKAIAEAKCIIITSIIKRICILTWIRECSLIYLYFQKINTFKIQWWQIHVSLGDVLTMLRWNKWFETIKILCLANVWQSSRYQISANRCRHRLKFDIGYKQLKDWINRSNK